MSESLMITEHSWDDAEALVDRLESLMHQDLASETFYRELVVGVRKATKAVSATLCDSVRSRQTTIASSPYDTEPNDPPAVVDSVDLGDVASGWAPYVIWQSAARLVVYQRLTSRRCLVASESRERRISDSFLVLQLSFDGPVDASQKLLHEELTSTIIGFASQVWSRTKNSNSQLLSSSHSERDEFIGSLYRGGNLTESLSAIAKVVAQRTGFDRVSILEANRSGCRLAASNVGTQIDRRSRQVRMLQRLASRVIASGESLRFVVGHGNQPPWDVRDLLQAYLDNSGAREIGIEFVGSPDSQSSADEVPVAAIVFERFRLPVEGVAEEERQSGFHGDLKSEFDNIRTATGEAIRSAFERDKEVFQSLLSRWLRGLRRRSLLSAALGTAAVFFLLALLPVEFSLPVEGRLIPTGQAHLYAPSNATVESIEVSPGQRVEPGGVLLVLKSPELDLQEETLAGELATHRSRLAAVQAGKTVGRGSTSARDSFVRSDQRILETMIGSLKDRLELVRRQQALLTLRSPIGGIVQRWDMQQTLRARPVSRGQLLMNVINLDDGWTIALDIPDDEIGYVLAAASESFPDCTFRLRSDPEFSYSGRLERIESTAHITPAGKSVVRASMVLQAARGDGLRAGSTVVASIKCGKRAAGFVWFRSLFEWFRTRSWA